MPDLEDTSTLERPKSGPAAGAVPPRNPAIAAPVPAPTPTATPATPTATPSAVPSAPAAAPVAGAMAGFDLGETIRGNMQRRERAQADLGQRAAVLERDLATLKEKAGHAPQPQQTNPVQAFGSAAMFLATMGSLMTRRPMLNALRAGAEVMEAYHKNDMAAQQQAFQTWKAETDAAMAIQRFEQQAYDNAVNRSNADLATTAAAMKDNVVLTLLQSGRRDDALSIIAGRDLSHRRLAGASVAAGVANQRHQFFARFQAAKTPEEKAKVEQEYNDWVRFNDPTAARTEATSDTKDPFRQDRMDAYAELKAAREAGDKEGEAIAQKKLADIRLAEGKKSTSVKPPSNTDVIAEDKIAKENERRKSAGLPEMTDAEKAQARIKEAQAAKTEAIPPAERAGLQRVINNTNAGMEHAGRALSIMNNTVAAAGGLARLGRAAETIGNLIGSSDSTARQDFKRTIIMLKQDEAQSANTSGARPMVAQMKLIDQLLETDQWGVSSRAVFNALNDIQNELYRRRQLAEAQLGGSWSPDMRIQELNPMSYGGVTQTAPRASGFDAFPTVPR